MSRLSGWAIYNQLCYQPIGGREILVPPKMCPDAQFGITRHSYQAEAKRYTGDTARVEAAWALRILMAGLGWCVL